MQGTLELEQQLSFVVSIPWVGAQPKECTSTCRNVSTRSYVMYMYVYVRICMCMYIYIYSHLFIYLRSAQNIRRGPSVWGVPVEGTVVFWGLYWAPS